MLIIQASYSEITQASSYYCGWSSQAVSVNGSLIQVCSNICFLSQIQSPSKANLSSHSSMVGSPIWSLRAKITVSGWLFSYLEVSFWGKSIPWLIQAVVKCQFPMVMRQGPLLPYWLSAEDCSQLLKVSLMSLPPLSKTAGPVHRGRQVSAKAAGKWWGGFKLCWGMTFRWGEALGVCCLWWPELGPSFVQSLPFLFDL